jgi:hypothetical protein
MVKTHKHIASLVASLALVGAFAVPMTVKAGTETATGKEQKATVEEAKKSYITGDLGFTATNDYLSRGIFQSFEAGAKFQPYLDLYFQLYSDDKGVLNNITFNLGFWSDLETNPHARFGYGNNSVPVWQEFDWMPGISFTFEKNFTFTVSYFEYDYPNQNGGPAARSINLNLAYNDTDLLGMWALHPHITFLQEVDNHMGLNTDASVFDPKGNLGQYYEIGIAPSFTFMKESKYPLTLTLPQTAGFGSSGFYGTGFGYFSSGGTLSVPLAFIPSGFGSWTASVGGTYYYLGPRTSDLGGFATFSNGDRHNVGVYFTSLGLTF